jgi:hypothetical protein
VPIRQEDTNHNRSRPEEPEKINITRTLGWIVGLALLAAAALTELRKPADERTWHGRLFGWIPYDLRVPTPGRVKATLWQPERPDVLVPTAFGVGWTINLAALLRPLGGMRE